MEEQKRKYFCIFGGGAIRGFAYIGAYRSLVENNIEISGVAGSSVGSMMAAFVACGIKQDEFEDLFLDLNFELFRDLNIGFNSGFAISRGNVFLDWLRDNLEKVFYRDNYKKDKNPPIMFKDLGTDLVIVTTDLITCKPFIFSKETTPNFEVAQAVRISSSMPGLMKPVEYENALLCDGDLLKGVPIWKLFNYPKDDTKFLEFRLEGMDTTSEPKSAIDYLNTVYSCITNYSTNLIMDTYGQNDLYDFVKIDTGGFILIDFNLSKDKKQELIKIGYEDTQKFFKKELPSKENILKETYCFLLTKLQIAKEFLIERNVSKTKIEILELFPKLCETSTMIDFKVYKEIFRVKNVFFANLGKGFLGIEKIKNEKLILSHLNCIIAILEDKLKDFK